MLEVTRTPPFRHKAVNWIIIIQGNKERPIQWTNLNLRPPVRRREPHQRKPGWFHTAARVIARTRPHPRRLEEAGARELRSPRWGRND